VEDLSVNGSIILEIGAVCVECIEWGVAVCVECIEYDAGEVIREAIF
jgi:hypothetical protein